MTESGPGSRVPAVSPARWGGRLLIVLLLGTLLLLSYLVVESFLVPLLWAAILTYVTWPMNAALLRRLGGRRNLAAALMTLFLGAAILLPLAGMVLSLKQELGEAFAAVVEKAESGSLRVPGWIRELPVVGPRVDRLVSRATADPGALLDWVGQGGVSAEGAATAVGGVTRNLVKFSLALVAAFFFYRDGERLAGDLKFGILYLLGERSRDYWAAAAGVTRAVVYGLVLTAITQGAVAAVGYWVAGVPAPFLLGAVTATLALVPFGAVLVWGPCSIWLLLQGELVAGVGLFIWGALAISLVDNVIRPYVISSSAKVSFLLVLVGVLGGVRAFGLVGLFVGPAVLAVLWSVWRQWRQQAGEAYGRD